MKLKSILAAAAFLSAPALLVGPALAADYDGHRRGDRDYSDSRADRGGDYDRRDYGRRDFDGPRHFDRRFRHRGPWWAHRKPWHWRKFRHADRFDYYGPRRRDW